MAGRRRPRPRRCAGSCSISACPGGDRRRGQVAEHDREHPQRARDGRRGRVALVTSAYHMPRALQIGASGQASMSAPFRRTGRPCRRSGRRGTTGCRRSARSALSSSAIKEHLHGPDSSTSSTCESHAMTGAFRLEPSHALRRRGLARRLRCWCRSRGRAQAQTLDKLSIQTDWRAQAEHGGYYQAIAAGLYPRPASSATCARAGPASTSASS